MSPSKRSGGKAKGKGGKGCGRKTRTPDDFDICFAWNNRDQRCRLWEGALLPDLFWTASGPQVQEGHSWGRRRFQQMTEEPGISPSLGKTVDDQGKKRRDQVTPGSSDDKFPHAIQMLMRYVMGQVKECSMSRPKRVRDPVDAKAEGDHIMIGGWEVSEGKGNKKGRWFAIELSRKNAPWALYT